MDGARPGPDQAHLAPENVEELRQLIETGGTEKPSAADQARVAGCVELRHRDVRLHQPLEIRLMDACLDVHLHGAELEKHEAAAGVSDAFLPIKNRAGRRKLDA